ncbi:MAG: helix-turn-helix transcriptional regulator [bacterium]|nr:helix-turn-helix transcriptional regulator [bacterium]
MDDIKHLTGKRIRELRLSKGLSQEKLAELVNIDQRSLSYIECGNAFPSKCLLKLAEVLEIELSEIFNFSHLNLSRNEMENCIKKGIEGLSDENIKTIYRLIKAMK